MRALLPALLLLFASLQAELVPSPDEKVALERGLELAFRHADSVLLVEAGKFVGKRLPVEVKSAVRGFQVPRTTFLDGIGPESGIAQGSRWLVAAAFHEGASPNRLSLARLPDNSDNRARVRKWAFPFDRMSPLVFTATIRESGNRIVFQRREVLRGAMKFETPDDNHWEYPILWPSTDPDQLYLVAAWGESFYKDQNRRMVHVQSIRPIAREELPALRRSTGKWDGEVMLAESNRQEQRLLGMYQAWQFNRAPLVAETRMVTADEIVPTGAGGTYVSLMAEEMLRGVKPTPVPIEKKPADLLGRSGFSPNALFVMGGHAHHFENLPEKVLSAGWGQGGEVVLYLPSNDENRRRVDRWVKMPLPKFACHSEPPAVLPAAEDLFDHAVSPALATSGMVPGTTGRWVRFEVVGRARTTIAREPAESMRLRHNPDPRIGVPPKLEEWTFYAGQLPDWQVGSRWWGYALPAGPPGKPGDWVFVPSLFLPQDRGINLKHLVHHAAEEVRGLRRLVQE